MRIKWLVIAEREKVRLLVAVAIAPRVFVGTAGGHTAARRTLNESTLDKIGFVDILNGTSIFANGCGYGGYANGSTAKLVYDG